MSKIRNAALFTIIALSVFLMLYGIYKGDINLIESFGRFICLDCIGIS